MAEKKIKVTPGSYDEKFIRENWTMPFGSMCGVIGQAFQGKGISLEDFEKFMKKAFELSMEFTERALDRIEKKEEEIELPEKRD